MTARALALLGSAGAAAIDHPGGTLLAHLQRVSALLAAWGARPELVAAGLCHAFYGTDGFDVVLLGLDRRAELAEAIGGEAEELVYFYASCDREASHGTLAEPGAEFRDRFTGRRTRPTLARRRDFAELTVANELDIATVSTHLRDRHGPQLLALFTRWEPLLSQRAWEHTRNILG